MIIRPAGPADVDAVCAFLHDRMNLRIPPERWRRLMTYGWLDPKPDLGQVAEEDGRIVGFVGAIHADRRIGGRVEHVVNITSWYLDKGARKQGLRGLGAGLMTAATADPDRTYTILTNSGRTIGLIRRLGYRVLDDRRYEWRADGDPTPPPNIVQGADAVLAAVGEGDRRVLLRDHAGLPVQPVLIREGGEDCLAVFSVKEKGEDVTYFDVLHLDDPPLFARHAQGIANALLPPGDAVLATESRFLHGIDVDAHTHSLAVPHFYKSARLHPWQIDHLYSELQLLDLKLV